jgi:hypothetical protein
MGDNGQPSALLPPTAQMRGEYLAEIKELAGENYLRREIGTEEEFEKLGRQAFFGEETPQS